MTNQVAKKVNTGSKLKCEKIRISAVEYFLTSENFFKAKELKDIEIQGKPLNKNLAKNLIEITLSELKKPVKDDERKYSHKSKFISFDKETVDAKDYFNLLISTAYELTLGDYKGEQAMVLYREGMYGFLSEYPICLIAKAIDVHCRKSEKRPTPAHIIKIIEGHEGNWDSIRQTTVNEIVGLKTLISYNLARIKELIKKES